VCVDAGKIVGFNQIISRTTVLFDLPVQVRMPSAHDALAISPLDAKGIVVELIVPVVVELLAVNPARPFGWRHIVLDGQERALGNSAVRTAIHVDHPMILGNVCLEYDALDGQVSAVEKLDRYRCDGSAE
jgi:hypothetical protein